jgi:hypothetical protein
VGESSEKVDDVCQVLSRYHYAIIPTYRAYTCFFWHPQTFQYRQRWGSLRTGYIGVPGPSRHRLGQSMERSRIRRTLSFVATPVPYDGKAFMSTQGCSGVVVTLRKLEHGLSVVQWEPTQVRRRALDELPPAKRSEHDNDTEPKNQ